MTEPTTTTETEKSPTDLLLDEFVDSLTPGHHRSQAVRQVSLEVDYDQLREAGRVLLDRQGVAHGETLAAERTRLRQAHAEEIASLQHEHGVLADKLRECEDVAQQRAEEIERLKAERRPLIRQEPATTTSAAPKE